MREVVDGILQRHIEIFLYFLIRNSGLAIKTRSMLENSVLNTRLQSAVEAHRECHLSRERKEGCHPDGAAGLGPIGQTRAKVMWGCNQNINKKRW